MTGLLPRVETVPVFLKPCLYVGCFDISQQGLVNCNKCKDEIAILIDSFDQKMYT